MASFFEVPYPYEGIENYPGYPCAQEYGAPGEIDEQNRVRQISVVPAPYQNPHPQVFISSSGSADSARWSGEEGFHLLLFCTHARRAGPRYCLSRGGSPGRQNPQPRPRPRLTPFSCLWAKHVKKRMRRSIQQSFRFSLSLPCTFFQCC